MSDNLQLAVDVLRLAEELIGKTETIIIDSGIYKHDIFAGEDETDVQRDAREARDIHTLRGSKNHPITLFQITDALAAMQEQFKHVSEDRSYYYEGIDFDPDSNMYMIHWGS